MSAEVIPKPNKMIVWKLSCCSGRPALILSKLYLIKEQLSDFDIEVAPKDRADKTGESEVLAAVALVATDFICVSRLDKVVGPPVIIDVR